MLAVQHLAWLSVGIAATAIGITAALRYRTRSWRWLLAGILLPALSATSIAFALAGITSAAQPRVLLLLDFSASARTSPWHDPAWVQSLAQRRLPPRQPLTVIAFAGTQRQTLLPDITPAGPWPAQFVWDVSPTADTDIHAALAENLTEQTTLRWIITDGLFPASAIPPHLERTAFTILPPTAPDAGIRNLVLQPVGEQLAIFVELSVTTPAATTPAVFNGGAELSPTNPTRTFTPINARVIVERDGIPLTDQPVEFRPSTSGASVRWLTLRDPAPTPAPCHYTAHVQLPGDPWPENDHAAAVWPGPSAQRTLIVGTTKPADLPGTFVPTDRFSTDPAQLAAEGWQTIIVNDVPAEPTGGADALVGRPAAATPLSPVAARALDRFVRDYGGGLLLLSDSHAFGPGRYGEGTLAGDLLEALSPVRSHPPTSSGLSVLFLLDASSSMNELAPNTAERKFSVLSHGVQQAAAYLADDDNLSLVTFNNTAHLLTAGPAGGVRSQLARSLASVQPAGGTNPDTALPQLADFLQKPGRHLVVLLTDGEIPSMDIPRWQALLQNPNTHLAIIAPPPTPAATTATAAPTLRQLAAAVPQSSWSQTAGPAAWAGALRNAILDQVRGTVQFTPLPWQTADNSLSATATSWTRTWLKPESISLASSLSPQSSVLLPVAALAQRGLGRVAVLTIADDSSPPCRALRQRLLAAVAAVPGDRRFTAAAERSADGWLITVDASDAGRFLDGQKLSLRQISADNNVPLVQTAPGHYETRVSSAPDGLAAVIVRQEPVEQLVARLQSAAVETTEYPATVQTVAPLPPGTILLPVAEGPRWTPSSVPLTLSPWLWLLAAATALAALWTRK